MEISIDSSACAANVLQTRPHHPEPAGQQLFLTHSDEKSRRDRRATLGKSIGEVLTYLGLPQRVEPLEKFGDIRDQ